METVRLILFLLALNFLPLSLHVRAADDDVTTEDGKTADELRAEQDVKAARQAQAAAQREAEAAADRLEAAERNLRKKVGDQVDHGIQITVGGKHVKIPHTDLGDGDGDSDGPGVYIVMIVSIVFLTPVLIVASILYYNFRKNRLLHQTVQSLVEQGKPIPPELLANGARGLRSKPSDKRTGIILVAVGIGLSLFSHGAGAIPFFIGLGFLAVWWLDDRHKAGLPIFPTSMDWKSAPAAPVVPPVDPAPFTPPSPPSPPSPPPIPPAL